MALFQKSVVNKYLKTLDSTEVERSFLKFKEFYGNQARLDNIRLLKEENYQEGFLREIFVQVLGYTINPDENYNLTTEFKNLTDAKKADGAILDDGKAIGVIELKSTKTTSLESITEQAFNYKNHQPNCRYIITSNFEKIRFYIDNATDFEEFNLFTLSEDDFKILYLILSKKSIFNEIALKLKKETVLHEENISKQLYQDYSNFKRKIFENLVQNNPHYDKLTLFKKSQKLLDRFLFVLFGEDSGLVPPNAISKIIEQWKALEELDEAVSLYSRFKKLFHHLDIGHKYTTFEIPAYNGGLFREDEILNSVQIDDEVLLNDSLKLSAYDFQTEIDVNILGHIFENSLNEIEELTAELEGKAVDKKKTKRKKEGVYYTPKYITKYIVENTVGELCNQKKKELKLDEIDILIIRNSRTKQGKLNKKANDLLARLKTYSDYLLSLKILDPACGSGAFLNQALEFLINEHQFIDEYRRQLEKDSLGLFDIKKSILENNIYGVDINEESVELAKLSLWLRTAERGRKLSDLNKNIKCGNSLIDDPEVAGEKAFKWEEEFSQIFKVKDKKAWHVTFATHDSRTSQRMIDYKVRLRRYQGTRPQAMPIWLEMEDEIKITEYISEIIEEDRLNVAEYNICGDHVHLLLVCEKDELPKIVGKIKAVSSRKYRSTKYTTRGHVDSSKEESEYTTRGPVPLSEGEPEHRKRGPVPLSESEPEHRKRGPVPLSKGEPEHRKRGPVPLSEGETEHTTRGPVPLSEEAEQIPGHLWTQKFGKKEIKNQRQLYNTIEYIRNNRKKHDLPANKDLQSIIQKMTCSIEHAFQTEYTGGFDVVIGNPPYVDIKALENELVKSLFEKYKTAENRINLYSLFIEKSYYLVKNKGFVSFINPNSILVNSSYQKIRELIFDDVTRIIKLPDDVFIDAKVETIIFEYRKNSRSNEAKVKFYPKTEKINFINNSLLNSISKSVWSETSSKNFNIYISKDDFSLIKKIKSNSTIPFADIVDFSLGITPYDKYKGHSRELIKNRSFHSIKKLDESYKPLISGKNITRYYISKNVHEYIKYGPWLGAMREERFFTEPRIIVRQIVSGNPSRIYAGYADEPLYFTQIGFAIIPKKGVSVKYLLALLNSSLISYYHKYTFLDLEKDLFQKILIANCKQFPIILCENDTPFVETTELILTSLEKIIIQKLKFLNRISDNLFSPQKKLSKKIKDFYLYDFKIFLLELKKMNKYLSLREQDEWEDYFNSCKSEINNLKSNVLNLDKKIDQMVYDLYGLTEKEIQIVENSFEDRN